MKNVQKENMMVFMKTRRSYHDDVMFDKKTKVTLGVIGVFTLAAMCVAGQQMSFTASADTCANASCNTTFQVNVVESLTVAVTSPDSGAEGSSNEFIRNKVNVAVTSNNASGFNASMTTASATPSLVNAIDDTETISTLASSWTRSDTSTTNFWGYSITDSQGTGTYNPMVGAGNANPISVLSSATAYSGNQDVYFGAKVDSTQMPGTYIGTVVFSVVTGSIPDSGNNPVTPTDPVTPSMDIPNDSTATYTNTGTTTGVGNTNVNGSRASGTTVYAVTSSDANTDTSTTTTQISAGDVRSAYTNAAGVTNVSIAEGSSITTALATTATVAAASGIFFFILAKRRDDDDEEDEM